MKESDDAQAISNFDPPRYSGGYVIDDLRRCCAFTIDHNLTGSLETRHIIPLRDSRDGLPLKS